ncbi:MAG: TIGR04211 family SH3 domain-containing protein [Gammaproteobacteria bacterium]
MNIEIRALRGRFRHALLASVLALGIFSGAVSAQEVVYVTDQLQLGLHQTVEMSNKALRNLKSGARLEVLDRIGSKSQVRTEDGTVGWVKSLYLIEKEPASFRVNSIEAEKEALQAEVNALKERLDSSGSKAREIELQLEQEAAQIEADRSELESLRVENANMSDRLLALGFSIQFHWLALLLIAALLTGGLFGWWLVDRRSRARHGGYRVY